MDPLAQWKEMDLAGQAQAVNTIAERMKAGTEPTGRELWQVRMWLRQCRDNGGLGQKLIHLFPLEWVEIQAEGSTVRCIYCTREIQIEPDVGWVDRISGDEGGTYDHCPVAPDHEHAPQEDG